MSDYIIAQTSGDKRAIILRGRSGPRAEGEEDGLEFGLDQRLKIKHPQGAPVGNAQVMGVTPMPQEIQGRWSDKYLLDPRHAPELVNFPPLAAVAAASGSLFASSGVVGSSRATRATMAQAALELLVAEGQQLRVQWGSYVRFGLIKSFSCKVRRDETIVWRLEFAWTGLTNDTPIVKKKPKLDSISIIQAILNFLAAITGAFQRFAAIAPFSGAIFGGKIAAINDAILQMVDALKRAASALETRNIIDDIRANAVRVRQLVMDLHGTIPRILGLDDPLSPRELAQAEYESIVLRIDLVQLGLYLAERERQLEALRQESVIATVLIQDGIDLRVLAEKYYDDRDEWVRIALFNGETRSVLPGGTLILIPPLE